MAQRWLDRIESPGQRNQCLLLLKVLLTFARTRGLADPQAIGIRTTPTRKMQNFLAPEELRKCDAACVALIAEQPERMAGFVALRVLIHPGCRRSEVLAAEREHFNAKNATLRLMRDKASDDGREVLLPPAAVSALASLSVTRSKFLFPSRGACGHLVNIDPHAADMFERAGVKRFASMTCVTASPARPSPFVGEFSVSGVIRPRPVDHGRDAIEGLALVVAQKMSVALCGAGIAVAQQGANGIERHAVADRENS